MYLPVLPAHVNLDPGLSTRQRGVLLMLIRSKQKQSLVVASLQAVCTIKSLCVLTWDW